MQTISLNEGSLCKRRFPQMTLLANDDPENQLGKFLGRSMVYPGSRLDLGALICMQSV